MRRVILVAAMIVALASYAALRSLSFAEEGADDASGFVTATPDPLAEAPDPLAEAPDPLPANYDDFPTTGIADINAQSPTGGINVQPAADEQLQNQNVTPPQKSSPDEKDTHPKQ